MPYIEIEKQPLVYQLRRSKKAKRLQMIVRHRTFEVVAPTRIKNKQIVEFVWGLQKWMLKQNIRKTPALSLAQNWPTHFVNGALLTFRGQKLALTIQLGKPGVVQLVDNNLQLTIVPNKKYLENPNRGIKHFVMQWYQQKTLALIQENIDYYCPLLGRWPASYRLKQQKTRWGSCGIQNNININWLLILAPEGVLEYVVVHELCHLLHRNHGKRFWAKVAQCMPHFSQYEKWLKNHGHWLQQDIGQLKY